MRTRFDPAKSQLLRSNPRRAIGFEEVRELFESSYYSDQRSDVPEQFRAIGWVRGSLYSVVYEVRDDAEGEFYWLITLWKATEEERKMYVEHS